MDGEEAEQRSGIFAQESSLRPALAAGACPQTHSLPVCLPGLSFAWISTISFNRMKKEEPVMKSRHVLGN